MTVAGISTEFRYEPQEANAPVPIAIPKHIPIGRPTGLSRGHDAKDLCGIVFKCESSAKDTSVNTVQSSKADEARFVTDDEITTF